MNKLATLGLAAIVSSGCTVHVNNPYSQQPLPVQQARTQTPEPQQQRRQEPRTISRQEVFREVANKCDHVQKTNDLPLLCRIDYIGDTKEMPALWVTFKDETTMDGYLTPVIEELAAPFCVATEVLVERQNANPMVVMILHEERVFKMFSCPTKKWSNWTPLDDDKTDNMAM